jgi:hypothetical protein
MMLNNELLKGILLSAYLLLNVPAYAITADCYSKEKHIFHAVINDFYYTNNYIVLFDNKNNMAYYLQANCIINFTNNLGK